MTTTLEELITCKVCNNILTEPKTLDCQHSCCSFCLQKYIIEEGTQGRGVECPQCKRVTPLVTDINELMLSFVVENLLEISKKIKPTNKEEEPAAATNNEETTTCSSSSNRSSPSLSSSTSSNSSSINSALEKSIITDTVTGLQYPWGITKGKNGATIVAEWGGDCVTMVTDGKRFSLGTQDKRQGLIKPRGVTTSRDHEQILVTSNDCITVYDNNGTLIKRIGTRGDGKLQFQSPTGLRVHPHNGGVYIADSDNHRMILLSRQFEYVKEFGTETSKRGSTTLPWDVAFDSKGLVYVANSSNDIQQFTADGRYVRRLRGELSRPSSLDIDNSDRVYVAELHSNRITVFNNEEPTRRYQGLSLNGPCGVCITNEELLLSDCWNNRVVTISK